LIVSTEPVEVLVGKVVRLIEFIAPVRQRVHKMGLEQLLIVGVAFDTFVETNTPVLTGQQLRGPSPLPRRPTARARQPGLLTARARGERPDDGSQRARYSRRTRAQRGAAR
jgi:hypothetical protein